MEIVQILVFIFFFKQKTAYEMRIRDWSSDVCSSDLCVRPGQRVAHTTSHIAFRFRRKPRINHPTLTALPMRPKTPCAVSIEPAASWPTVATHRAQGYVTR